jgi:hypothetical protein
MSAKKKTTSRHGIRAAGKTATSISLDAELLEKARELAEADGRTFSNWVEQQLKDALRKAGRIGLWAILLWAGWQIVASV